MIVMRTEFILPLRLAWIAMLLMIGFFGFFAQVNLSPPHELHFKKLIARPTDATNYGPPTRGRGPRDDGCLYPGNDHRIAEIRKGLDGKNEQVVYAMTFDQIFFHSSPSLLSILGTLIIVFSAIYVAVCLPSPKQV